MAGGIQGYVIDSVTLLGIPNADVQAISVPQPPHNNARKTSEWDGYYSLPLYTPDTVDLYCNALGYDPWKRPTPVVLATNQTKNIIIRLKKSAP
jgi:hypothetical protein